MCSGQKWQSVIAIGFERIHDYSNKRIRNKRCSGNGADEIDMVINIGWAKRDGKFGRDRRSPHSQKVCGSKILKVIIETCLLTDEEKIKMCEAVTKAGADYIKTLLDFPQVRLLMISNCFPEHIIS